jgi:hypothetical protein
MIIFCKGAAQIERVFIVVFSFFLLAAGGASAGYGPEVRSVKDGGGTWGSILEMSLELRGSEARFIVRKKDGLPFSTESSISIRTGSSNGVAVAKDIVELGSSSARLAVQLDDSSPSQSYYGYLSNSYGYAWVGPLKIGVSDQQVSENPPLISNTYPTLGSGIGLEPPRIDSRPAVAAVSKKVRVAVTPGICRDGVQLQCFAEDTERQRSNYYKSGWIWSGETVQVPFIFTSPGTQTLWCKTRSRCCSSPWVSRDIQINEPQRKPNPPRISSDPATAKAKVPVYVQVLPGSDPDGDQVRVECRAEDSDRTSFRPWTSGWFTQPRWADAVFTFESVGKKMLTCATIDRSGQSSLSVNRFITVEEAQPLLPSMTSSSRAETKINISVVTNADGTADSKVNVQSSRSEACAPFCPENGEITYDKPYLPDAFTPADGQPVYDPDDDSYIIRETVPDGHP